MNTTKILKYGAVIGCGILLYMWYQKSQSMKKESDEKFSVKTEGKIIKK